MGSPAVRCSEQHRPARIAVVSLTIEFLESLHDFELRGFANKQPRSFDSVPDFGAPENERQRPIVAIPAGIWLFVGQHAPPATARDVTAMSKDSRQR